MEARTRALPEEYGFVYRKIQHYVELCCGFRYGHDRNF